MSGNEEWGGTSRSVQPSLSARPDPDNETQEHMHNTPTRETAKLKRQIRINKEEAITELADETHNYKENDYVFKYRNASAYGPS